MTATAISAAAIAAGAIILWVLDIIWAMELKPKK